MTDKNRIIESKDKDDNAVKVKLIVPTAQKYRDSQIEYNKAFRKALDSGALLRQKLSDYMEEQGIESDVTIAFTDGYIRNDDLTNLVDNDVVIVLDHILSRYEREELEEAGARYIVAVDELKIA